jgi:hypothetical protein
MCAARPIQRAFPPVPSAEKWSRAGDWSAFASAADPTMPEFAGALKDGQTTDLVNYLQVQFGGRPAWNNFAGAAEITARNKSTL